MQEQILISWLAIFLGKVKAFLIIVENFLLNLATKTLCFELIGNKLTLLYERLIEGFGNIGILLTESLDGVAERKAR